MFPIFPICPIWDRRQGAKPLGYVKSYQNWMSISCVCVCVDTFFAFSFPPCAHLVPTQAPEAPHSASKGQFDHKNIPKVF